MSHGFFGMSNGDTTHTPVFCLDVGVLKTFDNRGVRDWCILLYTRNPTGAPPPDPAIENPRALLYRCVGPPGNMVVMFNTNYYPFRNNELFVRVCFENDLPRWMFKEIDDICRMVRPDNTQIDYSSQLWVLDVLDAVDETGLLQDDRQYLGARDYLVSMWQEVGTADTIQDGGVNGGAHLVYVGRRI